MTSNELVYLIQLYHPEAFEIDAETLTVTIRFSDGSPPIRFLPEE